MPDGDAIPMDFDGEPLEAAAGRKWPICDKTIGDDALVQLHRPGVHLLPCRSQHVNPTRLGCQVKLERASLELNSTGTPFFLATGFRKPHTPWRFPAPYLQVRSMALQLQSILGLQL